MSSSQHPWLTKRMVAAPLGGCALAAASLAGGATPIAAAELDCGESQRFDDPGAGLVEWTVPPETVQVRVVAAGGQGADAVSGAVVDDDFLPLEFFPRPATGGGRAAVVAANVDAEPGEVLGITVGGGADGADGGSNGGGDAAPGPFILLSSDLPHPISPGGGGGASDVRRGGPGLADRVVVAAGGGGAGAVVWPDNTPFGGAQIPSAPPDLVGDGGDAGTDGAASQGWVGNTTGPDGIQDDGDLVAGATQLTFSGGLVYQIGGGRAGTAGAGGAGGVSDLTGALTPAFDGGSGTLGTGGRGGSETRFGQSDFYSTAGGGGGGGLHGGGGGAGLGAAGGSTPLPGLVSGGGGGSSLGAITGLHDQIDGYVEITACVLAQAASTDPPSPGSTQDETPPRSDVPAAAGVQDARQLPATGPASLGVVGLLGLGLVSVGIAAAAAARRPRPGRGR
ncbi:MAG: hypothetical protein ACRC35_11880 [Angustibacter sp.]